MFWRRKEPEGETVLVLDVENGSVGAALVRLTPQKPPRLFGQYRARMPLQRAVSAAALAQSAVLAAREALQHASIVAARFRAHSQMGEFGHTARAELFLSPPWTSIGASGWEHDLLITAPLAHEVAARFGDVPVSYNPFSRSFAAVAGGLFQHEEGALLGILTGEVSELLFSRQNRLLGRATVPIGHHFLLRTLKSHGGFTEAEARSALLANRHGANEALEAGTQHWGTEFSNAARDLFAPGGAQSVLLVSESPAGEHLARGLSIHSSLQELFPQGGAVHTLRPHHLSSFVESPANTDVPLSVEALFIDNGTGASRS